MQKGLESQLDSLSHWIGRTESQVDQVTIPAVHRLAATLDRSDTPLWRSAAAGMVFVPVSPGGPAIGDPPGRPSEAR